MLKNSVSGLRILVLFQNHSAIFLGYTSKDVARNGPEKSDYENRFDKVRLTSPGKMGKLGKFPCKIQFYQKFFREIREIREFFVLIFQNQENLLLCFSKTGIFFSGNQKIFGNAGDAGENPENVGDLADLFSCGRNRWHAGVSRSMRES